MIDLKLSKKEKKKPMQPIVGKDPEYPWGTTLNFEKEQIEKLNLGDMEVGDMVSISGAGKIISIHSEERDKETGYKSMGIQIQKLEVTSKETAAKKMRKEVAEEIWD
jgi:hypothetical protein